MLSKVLRAGSVAVALVIAPVHLAAQAAPAAAAADPAQEIQQINTRLQEVQQQAMTDPAVQKENTDLNNTLNAAMERTGTEAKVALQRAETIKADVEAAQAAQDNAKLTELAEEAKALQATINAARAQAMKDPAVQKEIQEFRKALFKRMLEIEPKAQQMVTRLSELQKTS